MTSKLQEARSTIRRIERGSRRQPKTSGRLRRNTVRTAVMSIDGCYLEPVILTGGGDQDGYEAGIRRRDGTTIASAVGTSKAAALDELAIKIKQLTF